MSEQATIELEHGSGGGSGPSLELVVMANEVFVRYPMPARGVMVLGRGSGADVQVEDPHVSRRHARVHVGATVEVEDLGGPNGTFVSGRRLARSERTSIEPGAVIGVGQAFLVVQPQSASAGRWSTAAGPGSDAGSSALRHVPAHIVIADERMRQLYALAALAARSPINVLILGETGAGKEMLAQTIHSCSDRARGPFLALNCSGLSEALLESELFGHEKGAFSGAVQTKPGLLETASGGTVFLDEVGDMAPAIQARLLRVLEVPEVRRVGGVKSHRIDVRFVSATNRDLAAAVRADQFRQDLYFRLNVLTLRLPPLRDRRSEIQPLARGFLTQASRTMGRGREPVLTTEALARLRAHDWPGNVRELRNVIDRAVLFSRGRDIEAEHIQFDDAPAASKPVAPESAATDAAVPSAARRPPPHAEAADPERERIVGELEANAGNQSRAAINLGISRRTLLNRLDKYGVPRPRKARPG